MEDDFRIREANLHDLPLILRHRRAMFQEMGFIVAADLEAMQQGSEVFFSAGLRDGSYRGWFVEDAAGQVVAGGGIGLIAFPPHPKYPSPQRPTIFNVYTEPAFRRHGLARKLMELMIDWCRKNGYRWVMLHASKEGRPLNESMGFKPTSEMRLALNEALAK